MTKALTAGDVLRQKKNTFPFEGSWKDAFGEPERTGIWFIWGNSGNGKSSFVMQLCKELCKFDRVAYDSLEEGTSLTMQASLRRHGMADCGRRFSLLNDEPMDELKARLDKRKSFNIVVVDSFQYTQMTYSDYKLLNERYRNKLIIFDEADKLPESVFQYFISMYNNLEDRCGVVFLSTDYIKRRISNGLRYGRKGYKEIFSRIGRKYFDLEPTSAQDVYAICTANGITSREDIDKIIKEGDGYDFDLRRVKKSVHRMKRVKE